MIYEIRIRVRCPEISRTYEQWISAKVRQWTRRCKWINDPTRKIKIVGIYISWLSMD